MERTRIQTACRLIQRHPRFKNVPIIHIPENAPGSAGPHLAEHLRTFHNVITMEECSTKGPYGSILGVPATDRVTQTYQMSMMLSTQAVYYSENCQTYPGQDLSKLKDKFEFQLLCWERVVEYDPSKPLSKVREKWMSKHAAGNDDLAVCGLMLCEWPERFFQNPKYADWIRTFITSSNKNTNNNIQKNPILDLGLPAFMGQNAKAGSIQTPYSRSKPPKQQSVEMNYQKPQNKIATPSYKPHNNQSLLSTKTPLQNRASISTTKTTTTTKTTAKLNNLLSIPKRNLIY